MHAYLLPEINARLWCLKWWKLWWWFRIAWEILEVWNIYCCNFSFYFMILRNIVVLHLVSKEDQCCLLPLVVCLLIFHLHTCRYSILIENMSKFHGRVMFNPLCRIGYDSSFLCGNVVSKTLSFVTGSHLLFVTHLATNNSSKICCLQ